LFILFLITYMWIIEIFIQKLSFTKKLWLWGLGGLCFIWGTWCFGAYIIWGLFMFTIFRPPLYWGWAQFCSARWFDSSNCDMWPAHTTLDKNKNFLKKIKFGKTSRLDGDGSCRERKWKWKEQQTNLRLVRRWVTTRTRTETIPFF
jgi:hypothetical protein